MIGVGIAAATLSMGGVAVAGVFSAHTGEYPSDAEAVRLGGLGEYLDPAASDYGEVIEDATGDIPFPTEKSREISRQDLVADGQREERGTGSVTTGAVRGWTAQGAVCAWANEWAAATAESDAADTARAAGMLEDAAGWPAVTAIDSEQVIRYEQVTVTDPETGRTSTRTVADTTVFGYLPLVRKAAQGTDIGAMGAVLAKWSYCTPALMPDLPQAVPVSKPR